MIRYSRDEPTETGVYACRIKDDDYPHLLKDVFLFWYCKNQRWCYLSSDQYYRGKVLGWVGPLQRNFARGVS